MVDYGIGFDVSKIVIPMTMTLVLIAWLIPYFAQVITPGTEAQRKFQDFWAPARERLSNVVSGLNAPRSSRMEFYGNSLALGTEITDKEEVVFHVTPELFHPAGTRYYWRGYSYDRYENGFWANTVNDDRLMNPDDWSIEYEIEPFEAFTAFIFDFEVTRSTLIYSPGSPVFVGTSVNYQGESVEEGENYNGVVMNSKVELKAGDRVKVEALVSTATIEQLRNDHIDYPDWVIENYLDLPDTLPESFSILADEIQGELENPYDIADEITQYLREEITYSRQIDPIPRQSDPLEHFLFVSKSGYCNYYASSEVLLLRTLGIPARLSVGFAEGEYDQDIKQFVVSLDDSHAWPEVYFPTYGWIEFEPTAALPIPVRESGIENESERLDSAFEFDGDRQFGGPVLGDEGRFEEYLEEGVDLPTGDLPEIPELVVDEPAKIVSPVLVITPILTVLIILLIYMAWRELKKRRQTLPVFVESYFDHRGLSVPFFVRLWAVRSGLTPIEKYFSEVSLMLAMLGGEVVGKTPSEQVKQLKQLIPDGISASNQLLKEYQLSIYSEKKADLGIVRESRNLLWGLVIKARLRNIFNR